MSKKDESFLLNQGLVHAIELLHQEAKPETPLPDGFPTLGIGETATLNLLAPHVLGGASKLDRSDVLAHMDPPTPWITWATTLWNARLNQNLLHPSTAPFAIEAEHTIIDWLAPFFGMNGGHMCSGSTIANLTALWAARDERGIEKVISSTAAHVSIQKAAKILGLPYQQIETNPEGQIDVNKLGDISKACLVLTAGTTMTGVIDPLELAGKAKWTHVDAAWAGPLRLSPTHAHLLDGIDNADSIAISSHKWLFQPKDSAFILFRDTEQSNTAMSYNAGYFSTPNVGIQGSRGAAAIPLLATLIAWGRSGLVQRIDKTMSMSFALAQELGEHDGISLWAAPTTGITVFRPTKITTDSLYARLPEGMVSRCDMNDQQWLRSVAANPMADVALIIATIKNALY